MKLAHIYKYLPKTELNFDDIENIAESFEKDDQKEKYDFDKYLFLDANDDDNYAEQVVASAISLDVRGNYGVFLNRDFSIRQQPGEAEPFEWNGNIYSITVNDGVVSFDEFDVESYGDNNIQMPLHEWIEALEDWKDFYLKELGFIISDDDAINHLMGVLLLTDDHIYGDKCEDYMVKVAIREASERFGVNEKTLLWECKRLVGVFSAEQFYDWVCALLSPEKLDRKNAVWTLKEKDLTMEYCLSKVKTEMNDKYNTFANNVIRYLNIDIKH